MAKLPEYYQGSSIRIIGTFYNIDNQIMDPTNPNISIYDPDGTELVSGSDVTKDDTGVYHYDYDIPEDGTPGQWYAEWRGWMTDMEAVNRTFWNVLD